MRNFPLYFLIFVENNLLYSPGKGIFFIFLSLISAITCPQAVLSIPTVFLFLLSSSTCGPFPGQLLVQRVVALGRYLLSDFLLSPLTPPMPPRKAVGQPAPHRLRPQNGTSALFGGRVWAHFLTY